MIEIDSIFRKPLEVALNGALAYLKSLDTAPVGARAGATTIRRRLAKDLPHAGMPPERVIEELVADVEGGLTGSAGGRFFAWVIGGSLPSALAADWLKSAWDQNAVQFQSAPAAAIVEEVAGTWLKDLFGLPAHASFAMVTGCQMAHATCFSAARHALLTHRGWNVEQKGLYGAPAIRVITSATHHGSIERAIKLLGMGVDHIVVIATGNDARLTPDALRAALRDSDTPAMCCLRPVTSIRARLIPLKR